MNRFIANGIFHSFTQQNDIYIKRFKHLNSQSFSFAYQPEQQVFNTYVIMTKTNASSRL